MGNLICNRSLSPYVDRYINICYGLSYDVIHTRHVPDSCDIQKYPGLYLTNKCPRADSQISIHI